MIGKLSLKNFKTHEDTTLEFSPGINVITGDTGQGKTNILLGVQWVKDNRPLGVGCIRRGQDGGSVNIEVKEHEELYSILRKRSESENVYDIIKDGKGLESPFTAFGNSPPEVVSEILNLSDINVQKQRDQHFLVYTSPGQIATYIRSITKLDEIDQVTKLLSKKIRVVTGDISRCQEELKSTNKKLDVLNKIDLELLESKITKANNMLLKIKQVTEKIERVESIVRALKILEKNRIYIPSNISEVFESVDFEQEVIVITSSRLSMLGLLVDKIKRIKESRITLPEDLTILSTVECALEKHGSIRKKISVLLELLEDIYHVKLKIADGGKRLEQIEDEEKHLMEELSICPSCGVELTEESKVILLGR